MAILLGFLLPLWNQFKTWILAAGAVIAIALGVYEKGRIDKGASMAAAVAKQKAKDLETARTINEEVSNKSDADLDAGLEPFMRDKKR